MINNINVTSGYAADLPIVKAAKTTQLSAGVNVLWGVNGSGKTTLLRIIAAYALCPGGGWSSLIEPLKLGGFDNAVKQLPRDLYHLSPGKCKADMTWDRVPVFFANGKDQTSGVSGAFTIASDDGMSGDAMRDTILTKMTPHSSGQLRSKKLNAMLELLNKGAPDFKSELRTKGLNDVWVKSFSMQAAYMSQRPDNGRLTVLLDEPERHFDTAHAAYLWEVVIPHLAQHVQVIVATHHPFCLTADATWICSESGENAKALETYKKHFNKQNTA